MGGILDFIVSIFKPVGDVVDAVHTSDEERLTIKAQLLAVQAAILERTIEYETKLAEAQSKVLIAETQSESWLTRSWRPITMMVFTGLVAASVLIPTFTLPDQIWPLLTVGIGGYVGGRTLEKTLPSVVKALKEREES